MKAQNVWEFNWDWNVSLLLSYHPVCFASDAIISMTTLTLTKKIIVQNKKSGIEINSLISTHTLSPGIYPDECSYIYHMHHS